MTLESLRALTETLGLILFLFLSFTGQQGDLREAAWRQELGAGTHGGRIEDQDQFIYVFKRCKALGCPVIV